MAFTSLQIGRAVFEYIKNNFNQGDRIEDGVFYPAARLQIVRFDQFIQHVFNYPALVFEMGTFSSPDRRSIGEKENELSATIYLIVKQIATEEVMRDAHYFENRLAELLKKNDLTIDGENVNKFISYIEGGEYTDLYESEKSSQNFIEGSIIKRIRYDLKIIF